MAWEKCFPQRPVFPQSLLGSDRFSHPLTLLAELSALPHFPFQLGSVNALLLEEINNMSGCSAYPETSLPFPRGIVKPFVILLHGWTPVLVNAGYYT